MSGQIAPEGVGPTLDGFRALPSGTLARHLILVGKYPIATQMLAISAAAERLAALDGLEARIRELAREEARRAIAPDGGAHDRHHLPPTS